MDEKKQLNEILRKMGALKPNTEQITFNCNAGGVCDFKVVDRYK